MAFASTSGHTLEVGNSVARSNSSEILEERNDSGNFGASHSQTVAVRSSGYGNKSLQEQPVESEREPTESMRESESTLPCVSQELKDSLSTLQQTFVVSDATRPECPIIYASAGFFNMTGYSSKEVIGRNCRFLQGADTDKNEVARIREAIGTSNSYCGRLLNYKKNGTPFWNLLTITPLKDNDGNIIRFIGMQVEVSKYTEGLNDKALRPNALPLSLIRYDARQKDDALSSMIEVVQTVKHPHHYSSSPTKGLAATPDDHHSNIEYSSPKYKESEYPKVPVRQSLLRTPSPPCITSNSPDCRTARKSALDSLFSAARISLGWFKERALNSAEKNEFTSEQGILMTREVQQSESWEHVEREKDIRQAIDLATTLERIEKNFVITDPRLPDNPIIFASDSFLELTEYSREEILGRNCRFLQGPETDQGTVKKIRDAVEKQKEISVQLINYTKSGRKFWNFFHMQPMYDQKGVLQYFIGVQLEGSDHAEHQKKCLLGDEVLQSAKLVKATAENVNEAVHELPDANLNPEDLWEIYSQVVSPRPHMKYTSSWAAIQKILGSGEKISLKHFKPKRPLGSGDTGSVHLVELCDSGELYSMKTMDKSLMLNRNKVHRACMERAVTSLLDHPFLPTLYASFQTTTHVCLISEFYPGGELFALLDKQPMKVFREDAARFYAAEVVIGLEYLHCLGVIYRDLKPENILLRKDGHIVLADFDLSFLAYCKPQVLRHPLQRKKRKFKNVQPPTFLAEPSCQSNSFVGTEEYIAPEIITGASHTGAIDWWALGVLLYEMIYGHTPFRGRNRQRTFYNILHKDLTFPCSIEVSLAARQLIHGLLQRDPRNRLGSFSGANDIKRHPFFHEINWPLIRCMEPPRLDVPLKLTGKDHISNYKGAM